MVAGLRYAGAMPSSPASLAARVAPVALAVLAAACSNPTASLDAATPDAALDVGDARARLDAYLDLRFTATPSDTAALVSYFEGAGVGADELAALLRGPRASYPPLDWPIGARSAEVPIDCFHVDYSSVYYAYLPKAFDAERATPWPVLVVGHGGNATMSADYARSTARSYVDAYAPLAERLGAVIVAPASERGWSPIGDSLIFSVLSDLQRRLYVDADRVILTGQSMGGHLAWRSAMTFSDVFSAFVPMSGGYPEWVTGPTLYNLWDTVGYHTWGVDELYNLDTTNETLRTFLTSHGYAWGGSEAPGEHPIASQAFPFIAATVGSVRRQLAAPSLYFRGSGAMQYTANWVVEGWPEHTIDLSRPLMYNQHRFVRLAPRTDEPATVQEVKAEVLAGNLLALTTSGVRDLTIMLAPGMGLDLTSTVVVRVNGDEVFRGVPTPDLGRMLDLAREYDDRGRIFYAFIDATATSDQPVGAPWE